MSFRYLLITEKPSSAKKIAEALDEKNNPSFHRVQRVPYYTATRSGKEIIIVPSIGHLYSIVQDNGEWNYPVYKMKWVPIHKINNNKKYSKSFIKIVNNLSKGIQEYVSACDYDIEGSLIAYNILKHCIGDNSLTKSKRMLYSTLTENELVTAWNNRSPTLDFSIIAAGKTRHETDWLFGINLSRALTLSVRKNGKNNVTLSIGRVQGPTLYHIDKREKEISTFIPVPHWKIFAYTTLNNKKYDLDYETPIINKEELAEEIIKDCHNKQGIVKYVKTQKTKHNPNPPFNLGDLQKEVYKKHKISPSTTLKIAEKLYLKALISYPRTNSQKIPSSINIEEILSKLSQNPIYSKLVNKLKKSSKYSPIQGSKDDSAHPAIYPTGKKPEKIEENEQKIYDLICKRFLSSLAKPAIREKSEAQINVNHHSFYLKGRHTVEKGWMEFYMPYLTDINTSFPALLKGDKTNRIKVSSNKTYSRPPPRYNKSSLLTQMEKLEIGTKSTRTYIIDTLEKRKYITNNPIKITELGSIIISTLIDYFPEITTTTLTRNLETKLSKIQRGELQGETIIQETVNILDPILKRFKENEEKIGKRLIKTSGYKEKNSKTECRICNQKSYKNNYCKTHYQAYNQLKKTHSDWENAVNISWCEYIQKIMYNNYTGVSVKEIIHNILENENFNPS